LPAIKNTSCVIFSQEGFFVRVFFYGCSSLRAAFLRSHNTPEDEELAFAHAYSADQLIWRGVVAIGAMDGVAEALDLVPNNIRLLLRSQQDKISKDNASPAGSVLKMEFLT